MELGKIEVRPGQRVIGEYKRAGRESVELSLAIHAVVVFNGSVMFVATNLANGNLTGVYAECFNPFNVRAEDGLAEDAVDVSGLYFTPGSRSFGFVEEIPEAKRKWAAIAGARPVSDLQALEYGVLVTAAD